MSTLPRDIIKSLIGIKYLQSNIENSEFSYQKVIDRHIDGHVFLDIRFYDNVSKVAVLVETKAEKFKKKHVDQLFDYVKLEQELDSKTKIIAILAGTHDGSLRVWKIANGYDNELEDTQIKSMEEYVSYFAHHNINDKSRVLENTKELNKKLHNNGIKENLRSQFVGTCLLALKNGLEYECHTTAMILAGIKEILGSLLKNSVDKATKIALLDNKVLQNKEVQNIETKEFQKLLSFIKDEILPYINEASTEGHDILSYFFTTFNKYVNREDKNQAFTPNHIAHFMCRVGHITRKTVVLDPTCGSGTFLVQAMAQALSKCETDKERDNVKEHQIFGIEFDDNVYGLATTNMLIHGDGNSNIYNGSCFDDGKDPAKDKDIWKLIRDSQKREKDVKFDLVLMNPPYNASKKQVSPLSTENWGKATTDPSKGLCFVQFVADKVKNGRLLTLLPMQAAIGDSDIIRDMKEKLLKEHTLDAVFSLPSEMFYPGASAVACCMVFDLGKPHKDSNRDTFFGYFKDDGFEKRKGVGRVDIKDRWNNIEETWLDLYEHRTDKAGFSVTRKVTAADEWCAEAYMETDYSTLNQADFIKTVKQYIAYKFLNNEETF